MKLSYRYLDMSLECDSYYPALHAVGQLQDMVDLSQRRQSLYLDMADIERLRHNSGHETVDQTDGHVDGRRISESEDSSTAVFRPRSGTSIADAIINRFRSSRKKTA